MRDSAGAYAHLLRAGLLQALAYRAQLSLWLITSLFPLVMMTVWLSVVEQTGPAAGWDRPAFVSYYVAAAVVFQLTSCFVTWRWDADMRSGDLSFRLLRPVPAVAHYVADELSIRLVTGALLVPVVVVADVLVTDVSFPLGPASLLVVPALVLGFALAVATSLVFCMIAFWTTQAGNLYALWWGAGAFLSGWVAPVAVLPDAVAAAARVAPFWPVLGLPLELLLGRLAPVEVAAGFASALLWTTTLGLTARALWRRGVRRYQAVGG